MDRVILQIVVFVVGAMGMVLELVGVRLMAPYFGTSLIVWTNIIGVVLGSLSLGYYLGGKYADTKKGINLLGNVLLGAGVILLIVGLSKDFVLSALVGSKVSLGTTSFIAALYLFTSPSILFGMVLPFCAQRSLKTVKNSGQTYGILSALSTTGSIFGTFSAGFFFIPKFGTEAIFYGIAVICVLLGITYNQIYKQKSTVFMYAIGFIMVIFTFKTTSKASPFIISDTDSLYSRIQIVKVFDRKTGRPMIGMVNGRGIQSSMFSDIDNELSAEYTKFFDLGRYYKPDSASILVLGAGAYSYPKYLLKTDNKVIIDVVELDPAVTELSKKYFGLGEDGRLKTYHDDARIFINKNMKKYDVIMMDAYGSDLSIPFSLSTKEFIAKLYESLNSGGVVITNVVAALEGENSEILNAHYSTYKSVFPSVDIYLVNESNPKAVQNVIFVAKKDISNQKVYADANKYQSLLSRLWKYKNEPSGIILTDNYSPVEYLTRLF